MDQNISDPARYSDQSHTVHRIAVTCRDFCEIQNLGGAIEVRTTCSVRHVFVAFLPITSSGSTVLVGLIYRNKNAKL